MYRATTPTHTFEIPFDAEIIKDFIITYCQSEKIILEKRLSDCKIDGNIISVKLTQKETNLFDKSINVEMQMRVLTKGGDALASQIISKPCWRVLNDEVLE